MRCFMPGDPVKGKQQKKGNDGNTATPKSTPRNCETNPAVGKDSGRGTPTVTK